MQATPLPQEPAPALTLSVNAQQIHYLNAAQIDSLRCTHGALALSWQLDGLSYALTLYAEGEPWQAPRLPAGTVIQVHLSERSTAAATAVISQREELSPTTRIAHWLKARWSKASPSPSAREENGGCTA